MTLKPNKQSLFGGFDSAVGSVSGSEGIVPQGPLRRGVVVPTLPEEPDGSRGHVPPLWGLPRSRTGGSSQVVGTPDLDRPHFPVHDSPRCLYGRVLTSVAPRVSFRKDVSQLTPDTTPDPDVSGPCQGRSSGTFVQEEHSSPTSPTETKS